MQPRDVYALCLAVPLIILPGCTVPELRIEEVRDDSMMAAVPSEPRDASVGAPDASPERLPAVGPAGRSSTATGGTTGTTGTTGGRPAAVSGGAGSGGAGAGGAGAGGAAVSGTGGAAGVSPVDAGMAMPVDAGPNPCLVWKRVSSLDRAPADAVEGGLETTAGIQSRQYVCRVQPPDLDYAVPGKAIFGNGCLVAYRRDGAIKAHNQQNGTPFEVLTAADGCTFSWQSADNTRVPGGALDLSEPPGRKLYACRGDFQGPLSSGVQVGGVQGASDMAPRFECWFESYTSPMQPLNPSVFEVLVQAP